MTKAILSPLLWALLLAVARAWDGSTKPFGSGSIRALVDSSVLPTTSLHLDGSSISIEGMGAAANGSTVTISAAGIYGVSGTLDDGRIIVDASSDDKVVLAMNGANISSSQGAPIFVVNADKTTILVNATQNFIEDGEVYVLDEEPNAAIYSKDDLDIEGSGTLVVMANYRHGIASNDDLKIKGGDIVVHAANGDGLRGRDSIEVYEGASITVVAGDDGMQSSKKDEGFVEIHGGTVNINATSDGIQAASDITIWDGHIKITTGGGSANASNHTAKAIKADMGITFHNGTILVDAADDAIHSEETVTVNGGNFHLASADDAIRGNTSVVINDGNINITQSYEGIAGPILTINGGSIHIISMDDGISAGGGNQNDRFGRPPRGFNGTFPPPPFLGDGGGGNGPPPGRPPRPDGNFSRPPGFPPCGFGGRPPFNASDEYLLSINGGYLYIDSGSDGDGLDSNGHINITGGTIIVNGPTSLRNGALDTDGELKVAGGFVLAVGSAGMAQTPGSATSTQPSVRFLFDAVLPANTIIHMESENGRVMFTFMPAKEFQSFVFSSPDLVMGESYRIYTEGSVQDASIMDGLYQGSYVYSPGAQVGNLTLTSIVHNESNGFDNRPPLFASRNDGGGRGGGGPPGGCPPGGGGLPGGAGMNQKPEPTVESDGPESESVSVQSNGELDDTISGGNSPFPISLIVTAISLAVVSVLV